MRYLTDRLDLWALKHLARSLKLNPDESTVIAIGVEHGGGVWCTFWEIEDTARPAHAWGVPPKPVTEWSRRQLRRWLNDHPLEGTHPPP